MRQIRNINCEENKKYNFGQQILVENAMRKVRGIKYCRWYSWMKNENLRKMEKYEIVKLDMIE